VPPKHHHQASGISSGHQPGGSRRSQPQPAVPDTPLANERLGAAELLSPVPWSISISTSAGTAVRQPVLSEAGVWGWMTQLRALDYPPHESHYNFITNDQVQRTR
jgi:hypothetical protein